MLHCQEKSEVNQKICRRANPPRNDSRNAKTRRRRKQSQRPDCSGQQAQITEEFLFLKWKSSKKEFSKKSSRGVWHPANAPIRRWHRRNVNVVVPHFLFRVTCNFLHFRKVGRGGRPPGTFSISEKYPVAAPMPARKT